MEKDEENELAIELKVAKSDISTVGSGVARINSSHLSELGEDVPELIVVRSEKHKKVVKLVSDRMAPKKRVVLREDDIDDLDVTTEDTVTIEPYSTLKEDMKELWMKTKEKFKKDEEEEETQ